MQLLVAVDLYLMERWSAEQGPNFCPPAEFSLLLEARNEMAKRCGQPVLGYKAWVLKQWPFR